MADPVTASLVAVAAGGQVLGGIQQSREANRQADIAQEEAELRARSEARQAIDFEKGQKLAFLKSGVALSGSPLLVLAETRTRGTQNVREILRGGETQAKSFRASGRQALLSGFTSGARTAAGGFS